MAILWVDTGTGVETDGRIAVCGAMFAVRDRTTNEVAGNVPLCRDDPTGEQEISHGANTSRKRGQATYL